MKFYYTYVLRSLKNKTLYVGWTDDLIHRLKFHRSGKVKSTKIKLPVELIYYEACLNKKLAVTREKQLKSGFGRAYLKRRLGL